MKDSAKNDHGDDTTLCDLSTITDAGAIQDKGARRKHLKIHGWRHILFLRTALAAEG